MQVINRRRYRKQYVIGGSGIFDTISGFFKRLVTSNAAKQLATTALNAGKDAAKEIGKKAIDVGKTTAIDAGKRLVDKAVAKLFTTPAPTPASKKITPETRQILERLSGVGSVGPISNIQNINNLMMGDGLKKNDAISIQDLVRSLNGAGMKVA
jgi:hypothetical protein